MTQFINGNQISNKIIEQFAPQLERLGRKPKLVGVCILSLDASLNQAAFAFLDIKRKTAERAGLETELIQLDGTQPAWKLRRQIRKLALADDVDGLVIQLPTSFEKNAQQYIINAIPPEKDPDVLTEKHIGAFMVNRSLILPPCVEAVRQAFLCHDIRPEARHIVVVGYGHLTGRPISHWLATQKATVTVINELTPNPADIARTADIIVSGTGQPGLVNESWIKDGAILIDFGYGRDSYGKMIGDIVLPTNSKASLVSPVPGGMGPIMVACLLQNTLTLASRRQSL